MNLGELTVRKNRIAFVSMALIVVGGLLAYQRMGRLEDPEFTMAVAIMFGLSFACVLTLLVAPVLFAIFYGIHEPAPAGKKKRR